MHIPLDPPRHARTHIPCDLRVRLPSAGRAAPLLFARYMRTTFGLAWQMAGCTTDRVELRLRPGGVVDGAGTGMLAVLV